MLGDGTMLVRVCPSCGAERPGDEFQCEAVVNGIECGWSLIEEPLRPAGSTDATGSRNRIWRASHSRTAMRERTPPGRRRPALHAVRCRPDDRG